MDLNKVAKSLQLKKRAVADGSRNVPSSDTKEKDEVSRLIDSVIAEIVSKQREQTRESTREINAWIAKLIQRLENASNNLQRIYHSGVSQMQDAIASGRDRLLSLHEEHVDARKSLANFRKTHMIERAPYYPPSQAWNWGVLILIFSLEVVVNGFTLQDVHPEGFIGIITAMFMISFVNITVGLGAGFVSRYTNHYRWYARQLGWISAGVLLGVLLLFNCLVGHWRSALVSMEADINIFSFDAVLGVRLLDNFLYNPFQLSDFKSYLMAIVGFIFGCIAAWKGYNWEDPYPGYARVTGMVDDYSREYQYELEHNRDVLKTIKNNTVDEIASLGNSFDGDYQLVADYRQEIKDLKQRYLDFVALAEKGGEYLYALYRQENAKKRSDAPPPCFAVGYTVPEDLKTDFEIEMEETTSRAVYKGKNGVDIHVQSQQVEAMVSAMYQKCLEIYDLISSVEDVDQGRRRAVEQKISGIQKQLHDDMNVMRG